MPAIRARAPALPASHSTCRRTSCSSAATCRRPSSARLSGPRPTAWWSLCSNCTPARESRPWRRSPPVPGLAGFFSKDEILWQAYSSSKGSTMLWAVGLITALMTAFYMWRLMSMTFYGKSSVKPEVLAHVHESPASMTVPLTVLAIGTVLAGWLGTPKLWNLPEFFRGFEGWLAPVFASATGEHIHAAAAEAASEATEWSLMGLSILIAVVGIAIAIYLYHIKPLIPEKIGNLPLAKPVHRLLYNKWYVDEIYDFLFVNGLGKGGGRVLSAFDRNVV